MSALLAKWCLSVRVANSTAALLASDAACCSNWLWLAILLITNITSCLSYWFTWLEAWVYTRFACQRARALAWSFSLIRECHQLDWQSAWPTWRRSRRSQHNVRFLAFSIPKCVVCPPRLTVYKNVVTFSWCWQLNMRHLNTPIVFHLNPWTPKYIEHTQEQIFAFHKSVFDRLYRVCFWKYFI